MKLGELMNRLNSVWVGNEELLKDVRVKIAGAGCVFELENISDCPGFPDVLMFGDSQYINQIYPKMKKEAERLKTNKTCN